jgi:hypothetical protein
MESAAEFLIELNSIKDIDALILAKVPIKNETVQSDLNWEYRVALYKKVQLINERIHFLTKRIKKEYII